MSGEASIVVLSREQEDFLAFEREFEKNVSDLGRAIADSEATSKDAVDISNKGTWKMVWGSLNGNNNKELAQMTSKLASSLNVTQTVLQMVMKISHRKNGFLRQFHEVLVNKITSLTKDTKTLDANQRDVTLAILEEIETHVSGQLAQHDMVERHQIRLESIDRYIDVADAQSFDFSRQLALLSSGLGDLHALGASLGTRLDAETARGDVFDVARKALRDDLGSVASSVKSLDEQARQITQVVETLRSQAANDEQRIDAQRSIIDRQMQRHEELHQAVEAMQVHLATQDKRIDCLESAITASNSVKSILLRNAFPLAALILAGSALLQTGSLLGGQ